MLMLKIHIQYIFNTSAPRSFSPLLELVAAPARTQLAMTFLECLSSSFRHFESSSHAHTIFKNIKTVELWIQCCYVVVYMYVMYIVDMYFICLLFFFSVSGRQNKRMLLFMGCSGNVVVFFCVVETCFNRLEIHIFLVHIYCISIRFASIHALPTITIQYFLS